MLRRPGLFALCGLLGLPLAGFAYPAGPRPAFVKPAGFSPEARPPEGQTSEGIYWLLSDEQEDVASHSHYRHYARKVIAAAGLSEVSGVSIDFDPAYEKLVVHRITLWRKGAPRDLLPRLKPTWLRREEDWEDYGMLDGRKTLLFTLEDVRVGDVVEFEYTLRGDNPIFGGRAAGSHELAYGVPVDHLRARVVAPAGRRLYVTLRGGAPQPRRLREGAGEVLEWDLSRAPARLEDDDAPEWYQPFPRAEWSEFATWADVVRWAEPLYAAPEPLSPELARFVATLRPLPPRERVGTALRMVQDEVRYLGMEMGESSHKPAHPNVVYARRYGDCKDKALLFCSLMRAVGLEADPVLVNTVDRGETSAGQPSPHAFDHVIARVRLDGKAYFLDATLEHQKGDPLVNQTLPYGKGLAIARGNGSFDDIPMADAGESRVKVAQTLRVPAWNAPAVLDVVSEYTGAEAEDERSLFADESRDQRVREDLNLRARAYPRIRPLDSMQVEDDSVENRFVVRERYAVDSLCSREASGRLACAVYPQDAAEWVGIPDRRIRSSPYALAKPKNIEETVTVTLPEAVAFTSDRREIARPDFRFAWDEREEGRTLTLAYRYAALSDHVPLDRFPGYLSALDSIHENLGATLYPVAGWPDAAHVNHLLLFFCAGWAGLGLWAARGLRRLAPRDGVVPPHPRTLGGPLMLLGVCVAAAPFGIFRILYNLRAIFDVTTWSALSTAGSPLRMPALLGFLAGCLLLAGLQAGLWPLFFGRHRAFPRAFIAVMGASVLWQGLYAGATALLGNGLIDAGGAARLVPWLVGAVLTAAWITYLLRSRRALETFVLPLGRASTASNPVEAPAREIN